MATAELDALCQETALETALDHGLAHPYWLFINNEPETPRSGLDVRPSGRPTSLRRWRPATWVTTVPTATVASSS